MFSLKKSLILRIALPIIILILALGAILYFSVLTTLSGFARADIRQDLASQSRRAYHICNINFDALLLSGLADDPESLIIKQALVLGQMEDFFIQEGLQGIIYDIQKKEVLLQTNFQGVPPRKIFGSAYEQKEFIALTIEEKNCFAYSSDFQPWNWHILIFKNADAYSGLIDKVQQVYLFTLGSLMLVAFLMIFFIFKSINGPAKTIVKMIQDKQKPDYKGIDVFEFLSGTISGMMGTLQQSEEKYRMIVENSSHLVWEMDLKSRFTFVSPTIVSILGYAPDEVIGKTPFSLMSEKQAAQARRVYEEKIKEKSGVEGLVADHIHKKGHLVSLEVTALPFFNVDGEFSGYRGVNRDITERLKAEKEKKAAQETAAEHAKLALVGQVAGKMAHDFNNILGIIMGNTELCLMDCKDAATRRVLKLIFEQTLRGKNLTRNLVAFARDQEPRQEFFSMADKVDLVIDLLRKDLEGVELIKKVDSGLPDLLADPGMIEHALVNLLQNSLHAVSLSEGPEIRIHIYAEKDNIYFEIKDNGCGIPKIYLDRIYEPSFTLKGSKDTTGSYKIGIKGTGYGLSNVKKYINQHKGKIFIDSEPGSGTKIILLLPIIKRELTQEEKKEIQKEEIHFDRRILLVEDEQAISDVQYRILSQEPFHHRVDIAASGERAMALFDENRYDLVSLDYILPGESNGMDVYHHIRSSCQTIPILFVSGNIEFLESIKNLKQKDGRIDHLSKPCQNKLYVDRINDLLDRS